MALPSGLAAQLGIAEESTYGSYTAPDTWLEFVSESLSLEIERLESAGLRAGANIQRADRWMPGNKTVSGDINLELHDRGQLLLWKHTLGSMVSAPVEGKDGVYAHTFKLGTLPEGLTVQVGRPGVDGTVYPFSYTGCRVVSANLSCSAGEIANLTLSLVGQDETTEEALGTATYPTSRLLTFAGATLKLGSDEIEVSSAEVTFETGINTDRRKLGSRVIRKPIESGMRVVSGTFEGSFEDPTLYSRFLSGEIGTLKLTFEGDEIDESGELYTIEITATVRFDGQTPQVGGPDELTQTVPWKAVKPADGEAVTVVITSDEVGNYVGG